MIELNNDICKKIFPENFLALTREEQAQTTEMAKEIIRNNEWEETFRFFNKHLRENCKTEDSVINFVYLFIKYVGFSFTIPSKYDPYDLVGYILSKVNLEKRWDDCGGLFDDFANEALKIDLMKDPYYQFWRDPKIVEICKKYGGRDYGLH